jgi:hypothetical protein
MFDHNLYQGRVRSQANYMRGSIDTYIYELGGGRHARVRTLICFGVYGHCHVSADVISNLDEV